MSETMKLGATAYAHDSQRPGLVERLLMPWNAKAGEEPMMQTGKLSFMNQTVNRRAIMAAAPTGVAGIVAAGIMGEAGQASAVGT